MIYIFAYSKYSVYLCKRKQKSGFYPTNSTLRAMKDRIKEIMDSQKMSQQAFASFIDISPATLSSIFNGRTKPTLNMVEAIKKKFPDISTDWLMFGSGDMYVTKEDVVLDDTPTPEENNFSGEQMLNFAVDDDTPPSSQGKIVHPTTQKSNSVRPTHSESQNFDVKYIDKPQRHVIEIKVYYDDFTYESFVPAKK